MNVRLTAHNSSIGATTLPEVVVVPEYVYSIYYCDGRVVDGSGCRQKEVMSRYLRS
jgi:hypothetical protein